MKRYKVVLVDMDGSKFTAKIFALSFENALFEAHRIYAGYKVRSVELL